MIKGLYFKLNMDNPTDVAIHKFFTQESEKCSVNKIDLLYSMMVVYKQLKYGEDILNCMKALVNITEHECYTYGEDTAVAIAKRFIRSMGAKS